MNKREVSVFIVKALLGGAAIGIGAAASLYANSLLGGLAGRAVGACLFSIGLFVIIAFEMKLFTGMVAFVPTMGVKNWWQLPVCFVCNALGMAAMAVLLRFSFLGDTIAARAAYTIGVKLEDELWYVKDFCSAVLCGMLITFSVRAPLAVPAKNLSATLGVVLPVVVFAFCGFDHSVANMLYFYYLGELSWRVVGYIFLTVLGNFVGGALFPFFLWWKERKERTVEERTGKQEKTGKEE